ncbi:hypothetical protein [Salinigranum halophilum]|uniref:hypothetical protein n=1 Tax=Salinigranum halophilum TaxID=2565931 RepID=UPI0010A914B2|nr:hypothetical protein [Salinigranum halophilum]
MRVRDLADNTRCVVSRNATRVHLKRSGCGKVGKRQSDVRARMLNPEARVCRTCAKYHEENSNTTDHHDFLMSAEPGDLGLSDFGVRR